MGEERRKVEVNWVQASAGALAALTSALLLSTVGVAGTIIGAALGSVAVTVGSAVYSHYLSASRDRVAAVSAARLRVRRTSGDSGPRVIEKTATAPTAASQETGGWREVLAGLPWRRLLLVAAALFATAMALILAFELITGRAVSSYTGGTDENGPRVSVPGLGGGDTSPEPSATPTDTDTGTTGPTAVSTAPATPRATSTATTAPSPSASLPTPTPSSTVTTAPPSATTPSD